MIIKTKQYFTLPEVVLSFAILAIGLVSIIGVFPVALKTGQQAVKISESIYKARAIASLCQTFPEKAPDPETAPYTMPIKGTVNSFAYSGLDSLLGATGSFSIPDVALTRDGETILDLAGNQIKGITPVKKSFLNGRFQIDRVFMNVNDDFDTFFFVIRRKN